MKRKLSDNDSPIRQPPKPDSDDLVWVAGGEFEECCTSIRFFGDELDPDELTRLLGAKPSKSCRKGDVVRGKRYDRIEKKGKWLIDVGWSASGNLDRQINALLDKMTSDCSVWKRLTGAYYADVFCGLKMFRWNRGVAFELETIQRLADRGLRVDLDIYSYEDESGDD